MDLYGGGRLPYYATALEKMLLRFWTNLNSMMRKTRTDSQMYYRNLMSTSILVEMPCLSGLYFGH